MANIKGETCMISHRRQDLRWILTKFVKVVNSVGRPSVRHLDVLSFNMKVTTGRGDPESAPVPVFVCGIRWPWAQTWQAVKSYEWDGDRSE